MVSNRGRAGKPRASRSTLAEIVGRALLPHHLARWIRRWLARRRETRTDADAELLLYSRMLPSGFLHFGYFDDPDIPAEEVSFALFERAQLRYAERVAELVGPPTGPLLDAGCGMGGMLRVFRARSHEVMGLTPDRLQIDHLRRTLPDMPLLHCRFEDLAASRVAGDRRFMNDRLASASVTYYPYPTHGIGSGGQVMTVSDRFTGYFDTIVHAESLQYMRPAGALRALERALAPDGRWIVADYFRLDESAFDLADGTASHDRTGRSARSGWRLSEYRRLLEERGFEIEIEEDITPHILPTLGFARLLAERIGLPGFDFGSEKLRVKLPGLHYVVLPALERARRRAWREASHLDPEVFSATKRYLLMKIRRRIRRPVASQPLGPRSSFPPPSATS